MIGQCVLQILLVCICIIILGVGLYLAILKEKKSINSDKEPLHQTAGGNVTSGEFNLSVAIGVSLIIIGLCGAFYIWKNWKECIKEVSTPIGNQDFGKNNSGTDTDKKYKGTDSLLLINSNLDKEKVDLISDQKSGKKDSMQKINSTSLTTIENSSIIPSRVTILICNEQNDLFYYNIKYLDNREISHFTRPETLKRENFILKNKVMATYLRNGGTEKTIIDAGTILNFNPVFPYRDSLSHNNYYYEVTLIPSK